MIDFIKIHYKNKTVLEDFVLDEENFNEVMMSYEYHQKELRYPIKTKFYNTEIIINEETAYLKTSLHKLNNIITNKGNQNYNNFFYSELCYVIDFISENIVNLETADITQLEFGLNINTSIPAENIVKDNIIMHNFKSHNHSKTFGGKGQYKQFDYTNYYVKVYDKAKHFNRNENILRIEIKFIRKVEFNELGIKHIQDLKIKSNLEALFAYLLKRFIQLTIVDTLNKNLIKKDDYALIQLYSNERFWSNIPRKKRNKKAIYKERFRQLLETYNLLTVKTSILDLLKSKFEELINN
ncbi:hypothetical protein TMP248_110078 [Tenacibaculum maritimum]|uniref:hypothetical protein n=1 Tax=Tenacibaculum maritimum TaxID=107401 RepID=UPI0012E5AE6E|nr:hypothetical protein [Tenacibaculum maritimum]CAA0162993.1 hypothetical protein TMP248_110078 [Tenacibaculum maritimum]CAA0173558.1 conserved hypothetical protein [Tenacibaculum maritimum]